MAVKPRTNYKPDAFKWEIKGERQDALHQSILEHKLTFALGPAGTGKTLVAVYTALDMLDKGLRRGGIEKVVVTRPLTTVDDEEFGFLPGDLNEKIAPFMRPVMELLKRSNHPKTQEYLYPREGGSQVFEGMPLATMRGMTFEDCLFLIDEAQNSSRSQMEMALTRIGENCHTVVTGDPTQCDLKPGQSGLLHAVELFRDHPNVGVIEFTVDDVRRSDFVGDVIRAYAKDRAVK
jgi:phosphate starvation-inducible PhoH-like protein